MSISFQDIAGSAGQIKVRLVHPEGTGPFPAILLGHEGIGVTWHLEGLALRLAGEGYLVAVPDLYSRDRARAELTEEEVVAALPLAREKDPLAVIAALPEGRQASARKVVAWFSGRDTSSYLPDFQATLAWLAQREDVRKDSVGAVGFSFGAGLVGQILSDRRLAAAALFYGPLPDVSRADAVSIPLLGHFADEDPVVNATIASFALALASRGVEFGWTIHAGARHGFFNETRDVHVPEAAEKAWASLRGFFGRHLNKR
jgi:carboxymethylenebutenolidase